MLATRECGELPIMLFADCYPVIVADPKTYERRERAPRALGECRYRGLFVYVMASSKPNTTVTYQPYKFSRCPGRRECWESRAA